MKPHRNIPASVRQLLLNRAKKDRRPFNELLVNHAMERFLYRLSKSAHADKFILKGALMMKVWCLTGLRPTMDIDMLGRTSNREEDIAECIFDILSIDVEPDGLTFDTDTVQIKNITEDADYEGIRICFLSRLESARIKTQIDISFADVVFPNPEESDLPTTLDFPAPRLLCYSRESFIAEKTQAMVRLGVLNSRMKDFYDIWLLSRQFDFEGSTLAEAIRQTFQRRGTSIPAEIEAFTDSFINEKQPQWVAFRRRLQQDTIPITFSEIVSVIRQFLGPIFAAVSSEKQHPGNWIAPGPWDVPK